MKSYAKTVSVTMYQDNCPICGQLIEADSEGRLEYYMSQHKKLKHVMEKLHEAEARGSLEVPARQVRRA